MGQIKNLCLDFVDRRDCRWIWAFSNQRQEASMPDHSIPAIRRRFLEDMRVKGQGVGGGG